MDFKMKRKLICSSVLWLWSRWLSLNLMNCLRRMASTKLVTKQKGVDPADQNWTISENSHAHCKCDSAYVEKPRTSLWAGCFHEHKETIKCDYENHVKITTNQSIPRIGRWNTCYVSYDLAHRSTDRNSNSKESGWKFADRWSVGLAGLEGWLGDCRIYGLQ